MLPRAVSSILLTICLIIFALDQHCAASTLKRSNFCSLHHHIHDDGATHTHPSSLTPARTSQSSRIHKHDGDSTTTPTTSPPITNAAGVQTAPPTKGASTITCGTQGPIQAMGLSEAICLCHSGSSTVSLPVLTIPLSKGYGPEASCAYTAIPTSATDLNPITSIWSSTWTETYDCIACTVYGSQQNEPSCTTMPACTPVPTIKATWSNNTVPIGRFVDPGTAYKPTKKRSDDDDSSSSTNVSVDTERLFDGLVADDAPCAATSGNCDSTKSLVFDQVATVSGDGEDYLKITFIVDDSSFDDEYSRNQMLVAGLTMWSLVATKNCQNMTYKAYADDTGSGCGQGPIQKRSPLQLFSPSELERLEKRSPISPGSDGDMGSGHMRCNYEAQICQAPDSFHVVSGPHNDPYKYWLDVQVKSDLESQEEGLTCKELLGATEAAIVALSWWNPALAAQAQVQESKFIAMCSLAQTALKAITSGSTDVGDYLPALESLSSWA